MKVYRIHTNKRVIVVHTDERAILDPRLERSEHQLPALAPAKWHSPRSSAAVAPQLWESGPIQFQKTTSQRRKLLPFWVAVKDSVKDRAAVTL